LRIAKRKSEIAAGIQNQPLGPPDWARLRKAAICRQENTEGWQLEASEKGRRLPKALTRDDFRRLYEVVDRADDAQHSLMLRILFDTGVRVSELCNIEVRQVDLENCKIRIE